MLLDKAMYTQSKYNLLLLHIHNIYTKVSSYNGCKNTVSFALAFANSADDLN